jgi:hypothetical protein
MLTHSREIFFEIPLVECLSYTETFTNLCHVIWAGFSVTLLNLYILTVTEYQYRLLIPKYKTLMQEI